MFIVDPPQIEVRKYYISTQGEKKRKSELEAHFNSVETIIVKEIIKLG